MLEINYKKCSLCKLEKPLEEFPSSRNRCNMCKAKTGKEYYEKNKKKILERQRTYYLDHSEERKQWRGNNAERIKNVKKQYRGNNREKIKLYQKAYQDINKESLAVKRDEYRNKNRQKIRDSSSRSKRKNPPRRAANKARYRARQKLAYPKWANNDLIRKFYETSQGLSMLLGEWYHVDHIVPLQSDFVCGLHCEANLQVLLGVENSAKNNFYWPDMWEITPELINLIKD